MLLLSNGFQLIINVSFWRVVVGDTSLNLTSESPDLPALQINWQSEVLNISPKSHISPSILWLSFLWVLLLRNLLIISFLELIFEIQFLFQMWQLFFYQREFDILYIFFVSVIFCINSLTTFLYLVVVFCISSFCIHCQ